MRTYKCEDCKEHKPVDQVCNIYAGTYWGDGPRWVCRACIKKTRQRIPSACQCCYGKRGIVRIFQIGNAFLCRGCIETMPTVQDALESDDASEIDERSLGTVELSEIKKEVKSMDTNNHTLRIFVADFDHYRLGFLRGDWFDLTGPITEEDILSSLYKRDLLGLASEAPPGCDFDYGVTIIHRCEGFGDYLPTSVGQAIELAKAYRDLSDKSLWPMSLKWHIRNLPVPRQPATAEA